MKNETMMEQIRRMNAKLQAEHDSRREIALNRIRELRRAQREQAERNGIKIVSK